MSRDYNTTSLVHQKKKKKTLLLYNFIYYYLLFKKSIVGCMKKVRSNQNSKSSIWATIWKKGHFGLQWFVVSPYPTQELILQYPLRPSPIIIEKSPKHSAMWALQSLSNAANTLITWIYLVMPIMATITKWLKGKKNYIFHFTRVKGCLVILF